MLCGGNAELLLDYIPATEDNKGFFRCWYDEIRRGNDFYFLTHLKDTGDTVEILGSPHTASRWPDNREYAADGSR